MSNKQELFNRRFKEKLARAHDGVFIGATEWSFNEPRKGKPYWCPHIHGVTVTTGEEALKKALKKQFDPKKRVRKPVLAETWDKDPKWLRYCFKVDAETARRIETTGTRHDKKTGEQRECRDTDHQPLKSKDKLELLLHLDDIGIRGRFIFRKVQFQNLNGGPTFRDSK